MKSVIVYITALAVLASMLTAPSAAIQLDLAGSGMVLDVGVGYEYALYSHEPTVADGFIACVYTFYDYKTDRYVVTDTLVFSHDNPLYSEWHTVGFVRQMVTEIVMNSLHDDHPVPAGRLTATSSLGEDVEVSIVSVDGGDLYYYAVCEIQCDMIGQSAYFVVISNDFDLVDKLLSTAKVIYVGGQ